MSQAVACRAAAALLRTCVSLAVMFLLYEREKLNSLSQA
jgi:hypothetical protein